MNQEQFDKIRKELLSLLVLFAVFVGAFQIAFYKESTINVIKFVFSVFWIGVLPGYALMLYYIDNIEWLERTVIGTALGYAVFGIISYNIGLAGVHLKLHHFIVPPLEIIIGFSVYYFFKSKQKKT